MLFGCLVQDVFDDINETLISCIVFLVQLKGC